MTAATLFPPELGRVAVKVCGITTGADATAVAEAGADAIGINFWPGSKRFVERDAARPWLRELEGALPRVAVTVNAADDELRRLLDSGVVDWLQLHGDEPVNRVESLTQQGWPVFKAAGVRDRATLESLAAYPCPTLLLDAWAPTTYGGTGETMDWALGAEAVELWPDRQIVLAGGLTPDNVAAAVAQVRPAGVDVASGVESAPGAKDIARVRAFVEEARGAGN